MESAFSICIYLGHFDERGVANMMLVALSVEFWHMRRHAVLRSHKCIDFRRSAF